MWNLLATSLYLRNGKQSETLAELWRNSDLARLLGFREIGPNIYRLPSSSALSRFHVRLKEASSVREVFNHTVKALAEENPDFGKHTALDASDVRTHARAKKLRKEDTGTELTQNADESDNEPTRRTMTYAGAETDRSSHKFRCPLGAGAKDQCPFFDSCQAGPAGTQGRQVRISFETDIRRFAPIYPRSKRWKRLYNGRSAVERINSYAKEVLPLERHALRGKATIELRVLLAAITINVRTLNSLRRAKALADAA
ncbi:MAG: transposase [Planctomycetota bacterium]